MRKRIAGALLPAGLALILPALLPETARAQRSGMRMEIPVTFLAGNQMCPAGTYTLRLDERFRILEVRGETVTTRLIMAAKSSKRLPVNRQRGSLRLERYGDTYVLRSVWRPNETDGWAVALSRTEKELARVYPWLPPALIAESPAMMAGSAK